MSNTITNRYEFVYFFDVENGNPNGDPDAGNMPRIDPETNHGIVTDVCLKRKVRDYVITKKNNQSPHRIYVLSNAVLNRFHKEAYDTLELEPPKKGAMSGENLEQAKRWLCENFYDIRAFGAVMSTDPSAGVVRGPIQMTFAKSIDPIVPMEVTITRVAVTSEKEASKEHMMGRKYIVPYGLYRVEGYVSAKLAEKTGFSEDDMELFWEALENMFEHDRSSARGKMSPRKLIIFKHESALGNAPAHKLFELVKVEPQHGDAPARKFDDYRVLINGKEREPMEEFERILDGVEMIVKI